jgi:preprotein translocase subunit YajC
MAPGDKVIFDLGLGVGKGEVVRVNDQTVIVRLPNGKEIKRHIEKHGVENA